MRAYSVNTVSGNRGFAAIDSPTPLTDYIWGYLGTPKPARIYPVPPAAPNLTDLIPNK